MYTLKLLAPVLIGLCTEGLTTGQGDHCVIDNKPANVVKYYEPGKSCYKNGTFYQKCENSPPVEY
jgi:hypothetical protein